MTNFEQNAIRELDETEIAAVSGAYSFAEFVSDAEGFGKAVVQGFKDGLKAGQDLVK